MTQHTICNGLLRALDPVDFGRLRPHLTRLAVGSRDVVMESGMPIRHVYFPESGIVCFVGSGNAGTEVGLVGRDGVVGASVLLDVESVPLRAAGQFSGHGFRISSSALVDAAEASRSLRRLLLRYAHVFMIQTASTTYANANFCIERRLARSLLMIHDRADGDELELTHESLAGMLNVRRPGITVATHILEGNGLIRTKRGRIAIRDRGRLMALAGDSYGMAEADYERLIGTGVDARAAA